MNCLSGHKFRVWTTVFGAVIPAVLMMAVVGVIVGGLPNTASAQVNKKILEDLLKNDVENVGTQYGDIDQAITRFKNGKAEEAYKLVEAARKKFPNLPPSAVIIARLCFAARDVDAGRAWLERGIKEDPKDPEAYMGFAELALRNGRTTDAAVLYEKGLALEPLYKENAKRSRNLRIAANRGLSAAAVAREDWTTAETHTRTWIAEDKESAAAFAQVGRIFFEQSKDTQARQSFDKAKQLGKDEILPTEVQMGMLYERRGRKTDRAANSAKAQAEMDAAAKKYPKDVKTRLAIANWAILVNQLNTATANAEAAVAADPTSLDAQVGRGITARLVSDHKTAEKHFEAAHLQSPGNFMATNHLALVLIEQKDDQAKQRRALEFAEMNVRQYPLNGNSPFRFESATTLGWVYYQLGQPNQALVALQAVSQAGSLSPDGQYYGAVILDQQRRRDEAVKLLETAVGTEQPFVNRKAAEEMLAKMQGDSPKNDETKTSKETKTDKSDKSGS